MQFYKLYLALFFCISIHFCAIAQQKLPKDTVVYYKVKAKENLYRLSLKFNCSVAQLKDWNNLTNEDYIQTGQILKVVILPKTKPIETEENKFQNLITEKIKYIETIIKDSINYRNKLEAINYDSLVKRFANYTKKSDYNTNLALDGTRITERDDKFDSTGQLKISGYVSTYFAYYNDSVGNGNYEAFPTSAPLNNTFSLNMLMINAKYNTNKLRGNFTLQYGDIPLSAWSNKYNLIQEANAGFKLFKGTWIDAGFFRTHIGVESIQPRENITTSIATVTYYEPYYLSGAKLTFNLSPKFSIQFNAFNGFNTFVETNKSKAFGFSALYDISDQLSLNFNTLYSEDSPDDQTRKQERIYNNFYITFKSKYVDWAAEFNYGIQQNSVLTNLTQQAEIYSTLLVTKIRFSKKMAIYGRGEYYNDMNQILTGSILNEYKQQIGLHLWGATGGLEFKPIANAYLRTEFRRIETLETNQKIFYYNKKYNNIRDEIIIALGFWF